MAGSISGGTIRHRKRGVVRLDATITTDASGVATETVVGIAYGRVVGVLYDGGLDASGTITIKDVKTGVSLIPYTTGTEGTAVSFRPTTAIVDVAGEAITPADTAPNTNRDLYVAGKVSVAVASGGNAETGIVSIIVDETGIGDLALTV